MSLDERASVSICLLSLSVVCVCVCVCARAREAHLKTVLVVSVPGNESDRWVLLMYKLRSPLLRTQN